MKTIIGGALAFLLLDPPWTWIVIGALLAIDLFEIGVWLKWRKKRSVMGAESIVGARGRAVTDIKPDGQVKVRGQLWKAHSTNGVTAGDEVVVTGAEGIKLEVSAPTDA